MLGWSGPGCGLLKPNWDRALRGKKETWMFGLKEEMGLS
jgi:hypothetical protein